MSKSTIIAGAGIAALAIAAIPAVASFAEGAGDDNTASVIYKTTVTPSISISSVATGGDTAVAELATENIAADGTKTAAHRIKAVSNASYGYNITAAAKDATTLASTETSDTFAYNTEGAGAGKDGWSLTTSGTQAGQSNDGVIDLKTTATEIDRVQDTSTPAAGNYFTVTFGVKAKNNQAAGTYSRTVTYAINALNSSHEVDTTLTPTI